MTHAFGTAEDVPRLLADVAAGGDESSEAVSTLFHTIWHQGTVYEASAPAVPFLAELARSSTVHPLDRRLLLFLIFAIGRGTGYRLVHAESPGLRPPDDLAQLLADEQRWVDACRIEVATTAEDMLRRISNHPDWMWLNIAVLIAVAGEYGPVAAEALSTQTPDPTSPFGRAGLGLLTQIVIHGAPNPDRFAETVALDKELASYVEYEGIKPDQATIDSYFVDVLAERICDSELAE